MLILGLLGMYFDAAVVFVTSQTLLFRLALAILCFDVKFNPTLISLQRESLLIVKEYLLCPVSTLMNSDVELLKMSLKNALGFF